MWRIFVFCVLTLLFEQNLANTNRNYLTQQLLQNSLSYAYPTNLTHRTKREEQCQDDEWLCLEDKKCIDRYKRCNGQIDCDDKSDEHWWTCRPIKCSAGKIKCFYGGCVRNTSMCNESYGYMFRNTGKCNDDFECNNGDCIEGERTCDAIKDCSDGSDEIVQLCSKRMCGLRHFQCAYGACIDNRLKCDGKEDCPDGSDEHKYLCPNQIRKGCIVPEKFSNGRFTVVSNEPVILKYSCYKGYTLVGESLVQCMNLSVWSHDVKCLKKCSPLFSSTAYFTCKHRGENVSCYQPVDNGTVANIKCKQMHRTPIAHNLNPQITCENGEWKNMMHCEPECGLEVGSGRPAVLGGDDVIKGQFPWHVAIYFANNGSFEQICGGTIITARVIISAAHCFYDEKKHELRDKTLYDIGAGKRLRDYENDEAEINNYTQYGEYVESIRIPAEYGGAEQVYQSDIALVVLEKSLKLTQYVFPACIDFGLDDSNDIFDGAGGKVAGWGLGDNGLPSEYLQSLELTVKSVNDCRKEAGPRFLRFYTMDKFCVKHKNKDGKGRAVCQGDSGGGLVFSLDRGFNRYWVLRGVVSVVEGPREGAECRTDVNAYFTRFSNHVIWIQKCLEEIKKMPEIHRDENGYIIN